MINIEEFKRVCKLGKLIEITNSKTVAHKTREQDEGIEIINGKISLFKIIEMKDQTKEKVFSETVISPQINSVIGAFADDVRTIEKKELGIIPMKEPDKIEPGEVNLTPELPNFLTSALMPKWAKMSTIDRILMFQQTPKEQIYEVVVGKTPEGKTEKASYVKGNYMIKEANAAFLFDWNLEIFEISTSETGVSVRGKISGWFSEYGKYLSRPAIGYQERNKKIDAQQAQKGATTDAIKKGLSLFGFNSDVYSGEV